ncbi:hypothetical protein C7S20_18365 [Christiangramia fulva]|uniref:DUF4252 domain-containing protein n=2 Tax=Christiangramia fulva TaxID=2126553 RepID=A0A2R3Z9S9_9FLAO|nr:hypothetical protein C7S20_18365 [Christiangramia fulva]
MKNLLVLFILFLFFNNNYAQTSYQTFERAGFKVKSNCTFRKNTTFIQMAREKGMNNVLAAYICGENTEDPQIGVIKNINIYDESFNYKDLRPSEYSDFEERYLKQYSSNLSAAGITYYNITYLGVSAIEYSFSQQGLPTKAIVFLKNKKSYLLQLGTRADLDSKFTFFKSGFGIL